MKMQVPVSLIAGACIGAAATFLAMRANKPASEAEALKLTETIALGESPWDEDPFAGYQSASESSGQPQDDTKLDMSDPSQRDVCISMWYFDIWRVLDNLEQRTGHKFEKNVGKVHAGPVEILEEQTAFMRGFLDETERIASERDSGRTGGDK
jgi:hypothetical protein